MEPIKPIEGTLKDGEGQASVLAEVVRENYWKQRAQEMPAVESSDGASGPAQKQQGQDQEKPARVGPQRTYAEFEINQDTREVIVRIIDAETGKLVRCIPPEELAKEIVKGNLYPNQLRRRAILA